MNLSPEVLSLIERVEKSSQEPQIDVSPQPGNLILSRIFLEVNLPSDILEEIETRLSQRDFIAFALTCKKATSLLSIHVPSNVFLSLDPRNPLFISSLRMVLVAYWDYELPDEKTTEQEKDDKRMIRENEARWAREEDAEQSEFERIERDYLRSCEIGYLDW